ncbi:MAG TPA: hypothetical protein VGV17_24015 [Bosea sp. (in: a-proteobacteria)]|jgi:hypothetical protein|uniref:hypothetical protein n=1 Tax=Bosea sp. (in: a-proteobacteria) TaxID=1871050 RepID=UPI002DDD2259|nr:hypothetical protein [Bosea sp. (in: a-proteobacteria)]HEV2556829.1 hypothetical protein [Bosea sp. (in: a-proteobacteria)]
MIKVTDHALVRFLERSGSADFEPVRAALVAGLERGRAAAAQIGVRAYVINAEGHQFVVEDEVLITVLEPGMRPHFRNRRR